MRSAIRPLILNAVGKRSLHCEGGPEFSSGRFALRRTLAKRVMSQVWWSCYIAPSRGDTLCSDSQRPARRCSSGDNWAVTALWTESARSAKAV